jgi:hypothetical protein
MKSIDSTGVPLVHVPGWMGGWVSGSKSGFKNCLQQSKIPETDVGIIKKGRNI